MPWPAASEPGSSQRFRLLEKPALRNFPLLRKSRLRVGLALVSENGYPSNSSSKDPKGELFVAANKPEIIPIIGKKSRSDLPRTERNEDVIKKSWQL